MELAVQDQFAPYPGHEKLTDEPLILHQRTSRSRNHRLAVFIHGLRGSRYGTWGNLPRLLYEDLSRLDVGVYAYATAEKRIRFWRSIEIESEAEILAHRLREVPGYTSITLIGHSLGGVLAKGAIAYLATSNQKKVLRRIAGLILMASPQLGSLQVSKLAPRFSKDMRVLRPHSDYLRRINRTFQDNLKLVPSPSRRTSPSCIPTWAVIAGADWWVDELSSSIGLPSAQLCKVAGSHTTLVKPPTKNSDAYRFVLKCVRSAALLPDDDTAPAVEGWEQHTCEPASLDELLAVRDMAIHFFGDGVSPLSLVREWVTVNPEAIWVIKRIEISTDQPSKIVGYFCVLPLLPEGEIGVRQGVLTGANIPGSCLAPRDSPIRAVYVGAVAGVDPMARAVAMEQLKVQLQSLSHNQSITIYSRPITMDGLRVVRQYQLEPLRPQAADLGSVYLGSFPFAVNPGGAAGANRAVRNGRQSNQAWGDAEEEPR